MEFEIEVLFKFPCFLSYACKTQKSIMIFVECNVEKVLAHLSRSKYVWIHYPVTMRLFDYGLHIYHSGLVKHLSGLRINVGKYDLLEYAFVHRLWNTHGKLFKRVIDKYKTTVKLPDMLTLKSVSSFDPCITAHWFCIIYCGVIDGWMPYSGFKEIKCQGKLYLLIYLGFHDLYLSG